MAETAQDNATRSNVSARDIAMAERQFVESVEKLETAKGRHRNLLKQLKATGINVDMLKAVVGLKRQDPDDVLGNQKDFIRYARTLNLPIGTQLNLLDAEIPADELESTEREEQVAWDAGEQGKVAGKAGHPAEGNPHNPGTLAHAAWNLGHTKGVEIREAGGVGKRGRPKKVTDPAEGSS